jgi:hypothetical protein
MNQQQIVWTTSGMKERFRYLKVVSLERKIGKQSLYDVPFCHISIETEAIHWTMEVYFSPHLMNIVRKRKLGKSNMLWKALLNLRYGYNPKTAQSRGGKDGIFNVDEHYQPKNELIRKLFDRYRYTDKGKDELRQYFDDISKIQGVRVVAHGIRLLGFIKKSDVAENKLILVLVEVDVSI